MKSLMLKLLMIALSANIALAASDKETDDLVIDFLKNSVSISQKYQLKGIRIVDKQTIDDIPGWSVYFLKLRFEVIGDGRRVNINERIFTDGKVLSRDLIDMKSAKSIKDYLYPSFLDRFYDDENLIAGTLGAKNKLVVFSDPLCPFCMEFIPDIYNFVKKYPKDFALYYYHYPLNIHPLSKILIKASILAKTDGKKDVLTNMYEQYFDFDKGTSEQFVLDEFNKAMKTNYTLEQINTLDIQERMNDDIDVAHRLMINSTPSFFVNGKIDKTKKKHLKLVE